VAAAAGAVADTNSSSSSSLYFKMISRKPCYNIFTKLAQSTLYGSSSSSGYCNLHQQQHLLSLEQHQL
jgi:hypothetical protein